MTYFWLAAAFIAGGVFEALLGRRLREAGAARADHLRYWWRRKRTIWRGEDPDAWRNEYVTVMVNGIPLNVHPDELKAAEHMRTYMADAMAKLEAMPPPDFRWADDLRRPPETP